MDRHDAARTEPGAAPTAAPATAAPATAPSATAPSAEGCPCGLPGGYDVCCGPLHRGERPAPTAERLMRSRYSAFVREDEPYLLRSWASGTRPARVEPDPELRWTGLEIIRPVDGSAFHQEGLVEFRARYRHGGQTGALHETSRFVREHGAWVYLDGVLDDRG